MAELTFRHPSSLLWCVFSTAKWRLWNNQSLYSVTGQLLILELSWLVGYLISLKARKIIIVKVANVLQVKCNQTIHFNIHISQNMLMVLYFDLLLFPCHKIIIKIIKWFKTIEFYFFKWLTWHFNLLAFNLNWNLFHSPFLNLLCSNFVAYMIVTKWRNH